MSRIGKRPIIIPEGVKITTTPASKGRTEVKVQGPRGELLTLLPQAIDFSIKDQEIEVRLNPKFQKFSPLWGTARAVLANLIEGVTNGYEKKLELQGTGYKVNLDGKKLTLDLGYSRSIIFPAPEGIDFAVEKNIITVSGIDKQLVGEIAAQIRKKRKVEPYKGKGLRYVGEIVRRKEGKKAVGETSS